MDKVKAIRIADPYVIDRVENVRKRTGEATATKTASRLILERITHEESKTDASPDQSGSAVNGGVKASDAKGQEASTAAA